MSLLKDSARRFNRLLAELFTQKFSSDNLLYFSPNYIDNFYVRSLTNALRGELTHEHLLVAKGIQAKKFMVGIADYLTESLKRLRLYYNLQETSENCVSLYLNEVQERDQPYKTKRGSDGWNAVALANRFDMELYYYSLELFSKQGSTLFNRPYAALDEFDFTAESKKKSILQRIGIGG